MNTDKNGTATEPEAARVVDLALMAALDRFAAKIIRSLGDEKDAALWKADEAEDAAYTQYHRGRCVGFVQSIAVVRTEAEALSLGILKERK